MPSGGTSTNLRFFRSACWDPSSNVGDVKDIERLERFAIMSGLAPQSVDAIRPDFRRWVRYMKENGVTEIPDSPLTGSPHGVNLASMLIRQKAGLKGDSIAHELRHLTGTRLGSCSSARPAWLWSQAFTITTSGSPSCVWLRSGSVFRLEAARG